MLKYTYRTGRQIVRIFAARVGNESEFEKFVSELRQDFEEGRVFCEIWREEETKKEEARIT